MKSLWLKDRPWIWGFAAGGALAMAMAASERGFVSLWVLAPYRLELLCAIASCIGLLLGAVAVLWDDVLGTREFLQQRPIASGALARSPILGCIAVLLSCMVSVPLLTWLLTAFDSGIYDLRFWAGLPELLATMQIVWPACAIGCLAAAMPVAWWLRLFVAAVLAFAVAMAIDLGTPSSVDGRVLPMVFAAACLVPAVVLFWIAARLNAQRHDADRPWSTATRLLAGSVLVLSSGYATVALVGEAEAEAVSSLRWEYPDVVEVDGAVCLSVRADRWGGKYAVADADHTAVGEARSPEDFVELRYDSGGVPELLNIDAPRFHRYGGTSQTRAFGRRLVIARDGRAWLLDERSGTLSPTGIGEAHSAFPLGAHPGRLEDIGGEEMRGVTLVGDRASGKLWRYDPDLEHFVVWALPNGDTFRLVESLHRTEWNSDPALMPEVLSEFFRRQYSVEHIEGVAGDYVLKNGELVALALPKSPRRSWDGRHQADDRTVTHGKDPMTYVVEVPARDDISGFRHEFTPRTATERLYAGGAMSLTLLRPPVTQLISSAFANDETTHDVWLDRLVCGGKRLWLLFAGFVVAIGGALLVRRRLRRLGANASVCWFWFVAGVLVGPIASLLAIVCETSRRHTRPVVVDPPLPRILSVKKEIRA